MFEGVTIVDLFVAATVFWLTLRVERLTGRIEATMRFLEKVLEVLKR